MRELCKYLIGLAARAAIRAKLAPESRRRKSRNCLIDLEERAGSWTRVPQKSRTHMTPGILAAVSF
jgi:hypothetical protein